MRPSTKVYWAQLATKNLPIIFINHADDIALGMFKPKQASGAGFEPKGTHIDFPPGDISFLNAILPIGTKFNPPAELDRRRSKAARPTSASGWRTPSI